MSYRDQRRHVSIAGHGLLLGLVHGSSGTARCVEAGWMETSRAVQIGAV